MPGLKPRPTLKVSSSAGCEAVPFQNQDFSAGCEAVPCQNRFMGLTLCQLRTTTAAESGSAGICRSTVRAGYQRAFRWGSLNGNVDGVYIGGGTPGRIAGRVAGNGDAE